jgi:hypothetical protein
MAKDVFAEFGTIRRWIVIDRGTVPALVQWRKVFHTEFASIRRKFKCAIAQMHKLTVGIEKIPSLDQPAHISPCDLTL